MEDSKAQHVVPQQVFLKVFQVDLTRVPPAIDSGKSGVEPIGNGPVRILVEVPVGAQRCLYVLMPQPIANRQSVLPETDKQGGVGVAQGVDADAVDPSGGSMGVDEASNDTVAQRLAAPTKNKIGGNVAGLNLAPSPEVFEGQRVEGDNALARLGLGRLNGSPLQLRTKSVEMLRA